MEIVQEEPWRHEKLWSNSKLFKNGLQEMGFNTGRSETPITPIIIGDEVKTEQFSLKLFEEGVFGLRIVFPMVAKGAARIRTIVTAGHTEEELRFALDKIKKVGKELRII